MFTPDYFFAMLETVQKACESHDVTGWHLHKCEKFSKVCAVRSNAQLLCHKRKLRSVFANLRRQECAEFFESAQAPH